MGLFLVSVPCVPKSASSKTRPVSEQLSWIEFVGSRLELPCEVRCQRKRAVGGQMTLGLQQAERVQLDLLRRAIEIQRQLRGFTRWPDRDIAFGVITIDAAFCSEMALAIQHLANKIGGQLQVFPIDREVGADGLPSSCMVPVGVDQTFHLRGSELQLLQRECLEVFVEMRLQAVAATGGSR